MKKIIVFMLSAAALITLFVFSCSAEDAVLFDEEITKIEDSIGEDTYEGIREIDINGVDDVIAKGVDSEALIQYLTDLIGEHASAPLSALVILTSVMLLASVAESYTFSLRYTDMKDIMGLTVGLFCGCVIISPVNQIVSSAVKVIGGASSVMTVYLPVMAGIMAFSGRAIASGVYYAAVMTASKTIAYLASAVLEPILHIILSLSICAGIGSGLRLGGLIEMLSKGFKYMFTFLMSIFAAILGLNGALTSAADSVADKAAKFSLSSFIPLIGSSIAEAYGALRGSVGVLRSGIGVFVILSVFVAFAPLMIQTILWSLSIFAARTVGEALAVSSALPVLNAISQFIAALRTILIAVMAVFIIASGIMMNLGGAL